MKNVCMNKSNKTFVSTINKKQHDQTSYKTYLWAEVKTWNERDGESSSACRREKGWVGRSQMMEHSRTALPTCYRIFYYYGDFSVAPSFARTVVKKREERERDRAEGEKFTPSQEKKQWAKRTEC